MTEICRHPIADQDTPTLWYPGVERGSQFAVPTTQELHEAWVLGEDEFLPLENSLLGACVCPEQLPKALAAIDLCEVVRESALAMARVYDVDPQCAKSDRNGLVDYRIANLPLDAFRDNYAPDTVTLVLQELMQKRLVTPMPFSGSISAFLKKWRDEGIYVVADTSTLPGCEISTVSFLQQQYPGCFDGIVFPRGHDGISNITKASALEKVRDAIGELHSVDLSNIPIIAIDDTAHHAQAFSQLSTAEVFVPSYPWNEAVAGIPKIHRIDMIGRSTITSFMLADKYLSECES